MIIKCPSHLQKETLKIIHLLWEWTRAGLEWARAVCWSPGMAPILLSMKHSGWETLLLTRLGELCGQHCLFVTVRSWSAPVWLSCLDALFYQSWVHSRNVFMRPQNIKKSQPRRQAGLPGARCSGPGKLHPAGASQQEGSRSCPWPQSLVMRSSGLARIGHFLQSPG